jgi:hypothetical protein
MEQENEKALTTLQDNWSKLERYKPDPKTIEGLVQHTDNEVRITSDTGGQKGQKLARFDLLDSKFLWELAEVCGKGAIKYEEDQNWRRGYPWSLTIAALNRHLHQFLQGEDYDQELGTHHLSNCAWHLQALYVFATNEKYQRFDDRITNKPEDKN